jgi:endo-1,4-beta-xylanase
VALTCTVTGLTNDTAYTFTVIATNIASTSLPSVPSAPVTPT